MPRKWDGNQSCGLCIMPGLPEYLVQKLNARTVVVENSNMAMKIMLKILTRIVVTIFVVDARFALNSLSVFSSLPGTKTKIS